LPQLSTRLGTSCASLRSAKQPRTQFANFPKYKYKVPEIQGFQNTSFLRTSTYKNAFQALEVLQPYFKSSKGISRTSFHFGVLRGFAVRFFSYDLLNSRKQKIHTDELRTKATFTCPQPRIPFFLVQVVAVNTSDPSHLKYWLLCPFFYKEAMCKGSTRNGLLYAANAVP
jgi:hypothetical protein